MENAIANDDVIWHKTAVNFLPEVSPRGVVCAVVTRWVFESQGCHCGFRCE